MDGMTNLLKQVSICGLERLMSHVSCELSLLGTKQSQTWPSLPPRATIVPVRNANTTWQTYKTSLNGKENCTHF